MLKNILKNIQIPYMAKAKDLRYAADPIPLQCWSQVQINDIYRLYVCMYPIIIIS